MSELETVAEELEVLGGTLMTVQSQLSNLTRAFREVESTAARHDQMFKRRADRPRRASRPVVGNPRARVAGLARQAKRSTWWDLDALDKPGQAKLAGEVLQFGAWVRHTYRLQQLPSDWAEDDALTEDMCALYVSWRNAYRNPQANPEGPLNWHDGLARFTRRCEDYVARSDKPLYGGTPQRPPA